MIIWVATEYWYLVVSVTLLATCWPQRKWFPNLPFLLMEESREKPLVVESSCTEIIQCLSRRRLSSKRCTRDIPLVQRFSSQLNQGKWAVLCNRCHGVGLCDFSFGIRFLCPLLLRVALFQFTLTEVYCFAFNSHFLLRGVWSSQSLELSMLMRSFENFCPYQVLLPPEWVVNLILWILMELHISLFVKFQTDFALKTFFPQGKLDGLHDTSFDVQQTEVWRSCAFFIPQYVTKTKNPLVSDNRIEGS